MNNPTRVIGFVNAAHFIDHYSMLIFAAAVIVMGPALGMAYSELLPYATPGFVAFGAGSLLTGWLGEPPPYDGDFLCRHRRIDDRGGTGAHPAAARRRLAVDRRFRLDLSSRRYRDDRVLRRQARPRDGIERRLGQSRRGVVGAGHRRD